MKEELLKLLAAYNINVDDFYKLSYKTLINGLFEDICKDIKSKGQETEERKRFKESRNTLKATEAILRRYHKSCKLNEDDNKNEIEQLSILLNCFFNKKPRMTSKISIKEYLWEVQNHKCNICGEPIIKPNEGELDHIIAYDLVGDELENNSQLLCKTCNTRKGNSSAYEFSVLLTKNKKK